MAKLIFPPKGYIIARHVSDTQFVEADIKVYCWPQQMSNSSKRYIDRLALSLTLCLKTPTRCTASGPWRRTPWRRLSRIAHGTSCHFTHSMQSRVMCSNCHAQTVESACCTTWRRAEYTRPSEALRCSLQKIANAGCDDPCPQSWRWQGPCHSVAAVCSNCNAQTVESTCCTPWRRAECTRPSEALRCSLQKIANAGCDDPCPQSWCWQGPCHSVASAP